VSTVLFFLPFSAVPRSFAYSIAVWPKSHGFPNEGDLPYCDAHHLRAAEKRVNNKRLDKDFQEGGTAVCLLPWGASISDCDVVNYETSTTFDVPPMHRGDVARMAFYLEVHYGITEYGLELVDRQTYQSSEPNFAYLCTLRSWHEEDPVCSQIIPSLFSSLLKRKKKFFFSSFFTLGLCF